MGSFCLAETGSLTQAKHCDSAPPWRPGISQHPPTQLRPQSLTHISQLRGPLHRNTQRTQPQTSLSVGKCIHWHE